MISPERVAHWTAKAECADEDLGTCTEAQETGEEEKKTDDECVEADEAHDSKTTTEKKKDDKAGQTKTKQQAQAVQESDKDKTKGTYKDRIYFSFFATV